MSTLLFDANLDGQAQLLAMRLASDVWREFRDHLDLRLLHFEDVGLDREAKDDMVWRFCQLHGHWLVNQESDDSLEATIRREGKPESLPVLTFADARRVYHSSAYLEKIVEKLVDYLLNQEVHRGSGRLFLP